MTYRRRRRRTNPRRFARKAATNRRRRSRRASKGYAMRRGRRRGYRRNQRAGLGAGLRRIPFIGPLLASIISFAPQALFGAILVEPTMMSARFLGRVPFLANIPASLFYILSGLVLAAIINSRFIPLRPALKKSLAIAAAAAAGGVGYYKAGGLAGLLRGRGDTVVEEVGALELRGYNGPFGLLEVGALELRNPYADPHADPYADPYGEYGPTAVRPMGAF